jgi:glycerophosphoryl diester phosphodiesterase
MLRVGHRGAAAHAPENTLASFRRAVALGAQAVELDVHRSQDGRLVVIHDETIDRTTDGTGRVADLTLAQLRRYDAGSWKGREFAGERMPTLEEVAAALPPEILLFVELKAGSHRYPGIEEDLARLLRQRDLERRVRVSSFDHKALARLRQLLPNVGLGALFSALLVDPVAVAQSCGASAIHPNFHYLDADLVAQAHRASLEVHAWTVNDPRDIVVVGAMGVDGMISDFPERLPHD